MMWTRRLGRRYYSRRSAVRRFEARDGWSVLLGCATTLRSPDGIASILNPAHGAALLASGILPTLHAQDEEYPQTSKWVRRLFERSGCDPPLRAASNRTRPEHALSPALAARLCHAMIIRVNGGNEDIIFLQDWARTAGFNDLTLVRESFDLGVVALRESLEDAVEPPLALASVLAYVWRKATVKRDLWHFVHTVGRLRPELGLDEAALPVFPQSKQFTAQLCRFWCSLQFDEEMHEENLAAALADACLWHPTTNSLTFETAVAAIARLRSQGTSTSLATSRAAARIPVRFTSSSEQHGALHHSLISDHRATYGQTMPVSTLSSQQEPIHSPPIQNSHYKFTHEIASHSNDFPLGFHQKNDASLTPPWTVAAETWRRRHTEALADAWAQAHSRRRHQPWLLAALSSPAVIEACVEKQQPVPRALLAAAIPSGSSGSLCRAALIEAALSAASGSSSTGRGNSHHYLRRRHIALGSKDRSVENNTMSSSSDDHRYAPPGSTTGDGNISSTFVVDDESSQTASRVRKLEAAVALAKRIIHLEIAYCPLDDAWRYRLCLAVFQHGAHDVQGAEALLVDCLGLPLLRASAARLAATYDSARWLHALANDHGLDLDDLGQSNESSPDNFTTNSQSSSSWQYADQYYSQLRLGKGEAQHSKHHPSKSPTGGSLLRPLAVAAANDATHALRYLLHRAVRPDHPTKDIVATPLSLAARAGHTEALSLLLAAGADPSAPDPQGNTPLHFARSVEIAQSLLDHGSDPRIRNNTGHTPYDILPAHITRYLRRDSLFPATSQQFPSNGQAQHVRNDKEGTELSRQQGSTVDDIEDIHHHEYVAGAEGSGSTTSPSTSKTSKSTGTTVSKTSPATTTKITKRK